MSCKCDCWLLHQDAAGLCSAIDQNVFLTIVCDHYDSMLHYQHLWQPTWSSSMSCSSSLSGFSNRGFLTWYSRNRSLLLMRALLVQWRILLVFIPTIYLSTMSRPVIRKIAPSENVWVWLNSMCFGTRIKFNNWRNVIAATNLTQLACGQPERNDQSAIFIINLVFGILAFVAVAMRLVTRTAFVGVSFGWDDVVIILAEVISLRPSNNGLTDKV